MIVKDLMSTNISMVLPEDSISNVIELMRGENIGAVPVCDSQRHLLGIITDRDIVMRQGEKLTAQSIMTSSPIYVSSKDNIHDAAMVFSQNAVRRLPVVDNDKLVGMLSIYDLARKKMFIAEIGHIIYAISNKK